MVTKPTINLNGTSPGELPEQHVLAIDGLRSAISTLRAAAPNARDYQTERLVRIGHERASRPARAARKRDGRTRATRRIYFGSVLRRDRCGRSSAGLAQLLLNRFQPVPESSIYGAGFFWRDSPRGDVGQYSALKHCDLV